MLPRAVAPGVTSFILDSEAVAVNPTTGAIQPFQVYTLAACAHSHGIWLVEHISQSRMHAPRSFLLEKGKMRALITLSCPSAFLRSTSYSSMESRYCRFEIWSPHFTSSVIV